MLSQLYGLYWHGGCSSEEAEEVCILLGHKTLLFARQQIVVPYLVAKSKTIIKCWKSQGRTIITQAGSR